MPNSDGEQCENNNLNQEDNKKVQNKRKRNKNRKKSGIKVENLVSKTFQAKLETNSSQSKSPVEKKCPVQPEKGKAHIHVHNNLDKVILDQTAARDLQTKCGAQQNDSKQHTANESKDSVHKHNKGLKTGDLITHSAKMVQPTAAIAAEKSREDILAEREAKKLAKQQAKNKNKDTNAKLQTDAQPKISSKDKISTKNKSPAKVLETQNISGDQNTGVDNKKHRKEETNEKKSPKGDLVKPSPVGDSSLEKKNKKTELTKAERRAIQEAQRAAKAETALKKPIEEKKVMSAASKEVTQGRADKLPPAKNTKDCKVKLFNHLENCQEDSNLFVNNSHIHPIIVKLGEQYAKRTIVGSNARCISFLNALKTVIQDYETPAKKEFARSLETIIKNSVDHLHKCRPLAVAVCNAYKHIKHVLTQLPVDQPESELKERLCHFIDTYIENQIEKAAQAISSSVQDKISNGDVILTFGCSSLINYIFEEAHRRHVDFRVIVVDSRPFSEGQELLRRLTVKEIPCTYVLINAVGFVMPEVTKILLGAHALLSNGYVMARTGTAQVALVARSFNVPVLVCCETHKFSERFQTDAIVYNELGNPNDLVIDDKCRLMNWKSQNKLSLLNLNYDITPPELVTAVVTEVAILPCTSVPVILRIKPTEIGY